MVESQGKVRQCRKREGEVERKEKGDKYRKKEK
jgi:hypothetical protein